MKTPVLIVGGGRTGVLVRPDRFVAWRSLGAAPDPAATLGRALAQVLAIGSSAVQEDSPARERAASPPEASPRARRA